MRGAALLLTLSTLPSVAVLADEGEMGLTVAAGIEGTTVQHPKGVPGGAPQNMSPAIVTAATVQYGVTNVLDGGIGLEAAVAGNVTTPHASVRGAAGDVITGLVLDARLPVAIAAHLDTGLPVSAGLVLETGPAMTFWLSSALIDADRADTTSLPVRLPITVDDELAFGGFVRVRASLRARPFDSVALAIEPSVSASWTGRLVLAAGITIHARWLPAVGPI